MTEYRSSPWKQFRQPATEEPPGLLHHETNTLKQKKPH
jgi:hypothetical protein